MKKLFIVSLISLTFGLTPKAQQAGTDLLQNETTTAAVPVSQPGLTNNRFCSEKNTFNSPDPEPVDKAYYLKKSRNNRIASICLAGGGLIIGGIGALTFPKDYDLIFDNERSKENQADASTALVIVGCAALLSSIPFTVMASVNKRKASLMVTSQKTGFGVPPNVSKGITGITMTIPIGKRF